ncbi:nitroreductase [Bacillus sp. UMB0899]|uniref:nitroreductase family protein n=1 Tax=Metabacillus schmidteae TaxID=2730405 RepID=UPI000C7FCC95|nr:nitroreductase family protein [Metabacillus schmidteae]PMC36004.1 nitroreductase [Bacillus sp. UMB0899]
MDFKEVVKNRREITKFSNKEIPMEILDEIIHQVSLSPTGNNLPSREFVIVQTRKTLDYLSVTTPYMQWLKEAQTAIVITGCPNISKYWLQDASIASSYIWLAAVNEGLGCAFGAVYNITNEAETSQRENYVRTALSIPHDRKIVAILGLGYVSEHPSKKKIIPKEDIFHYEEFNQ